MSLSKLLCTFLVLFISSQVDAYSTPSSSSCSNNVNQQPINRLTFLKHTVVASTTLLVTNTNAVQAKEVDPALKGTKDDPAYQACLSKCIFECTKPKGDEQKSRAECIPECKQKCATSKQQLMIGTPKN